MRLAILLPAQSTSDAFPQSSEIDGGFDIAHYFDGDHCDTFRLSNDAWQDEIKRIPFDDYDVTVNLCDGSPDEATPGIGVVRFLEKRNVAFTGATSVFYDVSRAQMKAAAIAVGGRIPRSVFVDGTNAFPAALADLAYPIIVKHPQSYGSIGLTEASRVHDAQSLKVQIDITLARFGGALAEAFIAGREFTVLVAERFGMGNGTLAFLPLEIVFPAGQTFKTESAVWHDHASLTYRITPPSHLSDSLMAQSALIFTALQGSGYARLDFRVSDNDDIFFLEVNPNCGIFATVQDHCTADLILHSEPDHIATFRSCILQSALARANGALASAVCEAAKAID